MVGVLGYAAMALIWSIPAWYRWGGRVSLVFVGYALVASLLPDVDRLLPGVAAQGPTHTVAFVLAVALVGGAIVAVLAERVITRWWFEDEGWLPARSTIYAYGTVGLLVGGLSHVVVDLLSTSGGQRALTPLWPVVTDSVSIDLLGTLSDPSWSASLLVVALSLHVGLFVVDRC